MREVGAEELFRVCADPFVRHHVNPAFTRRAWLSEGAAVINSTRGRPEVAADGPVFTCLGPPAPLDPLLRAVAAAVKPPWRLTVETTSYDAVPNPWRHAHHHSWHWMSTRTLPPPPVAVVEVLTDAAEIDDVLDAANPDSFARPGTPGEECWLGIREAGDLVAVGALLRMHDGTGHLRGVSVLPSASGRGLGGAVSAALTRRALATGSGIATLGAYTNNAAAIALYGRLGYAVAHTFVSGPVGLSTAGPGPQ